MQNLLYIGLNGLAGSGKDTVAKMLSVILNYNWNSLEECKEFYKSVFSNPTISATHNDFIKGDQSVLCIAYADQLKNVCSTIFGIPVDRFYQNKSTAWVCINKDFKYTEIKPDNDHLVTAEDYYTNINFYKNSDNSYYMSLREILVYIGTYVLQQDVNQRIFVNIVRNTIKEQFYLNKNLKYAIITDIRFEHEIEYIRENNGITLTIVRDDVQQLDNIAEHTLDNNDSWDFKIENNGTYDELFEKVWNLVHDYCVFSNICVPLQTRDNINNYLRLYCDNTLKYYNICSPYEVQRVIHENGIITSIDLIGGPTISIGNIIPNTNILVSNIQFNQISNKFIIQESEQEKN